MPISILMSIVVVVIFGHLGTPASGTMEPAHPYATEFEQARSETDNPLQLEILADDVVTAEEYEATTSAFLNCMHEAGYEVVPESDLLMPALYQFSWQFPDATPGSEIPQSTFHAYDQQFDDCYFEWAIQVHMMYSSVIYFPGNEDVFDANLACLLADGHVPDDFDLADLEHAAMTGDWGIGVNPGTMEFTLCLVNPFKIGMDAPASPSATP